MSIRIGDLVSIRSFPAVVQSAEVRVLRDAPADSSQLADFCGGYLGYDDRSRHALETALASLASGRGGAFFFNGVFGSGKSHLLGLLLLLLEGRGWPEFALSHPHLAPLKERIAASFAVYFSLDEWNAAEHSLEEVFWREVGREWQRKFAEDFPLANEIVGARGETWAAFDELLAARNLGGCAIFIDELSLFLGGREHHLLQRDAAWLQFLGQHARRQNQRPVWVFGALQKTIEDIGDVDAYAVSQIRDRFATLPLALAHLPSLIARRLVQKQDETKLARLCDDSYAALARALPRLDFGREEWHTLYPFHPATVALLEQIAPRYFSRTRSAALFLSRAVDPNSPASQRVLPPQLFDDIEAELPLHPDLKPIAAAWAQWQAAETDVARDATEAGHLRAVWKTLALWKIAGAAPTIGQVVNGLALDAKLPGDGSYEYGRILLERLRAHAPVAVERRDGEFQDRYALDFGARTGELARRFTANALANLAPRDGRVARFVLGCSRDETLPIASLDGTTEFPFWRNAARRVEIGVVSAPRAPDILANRVAALQLPGGADALLFIAPPFGDNSESDLWRAALRAAFATAQCEKRWRGAVAWWLPRAPSDDESQQAREATAQHLLLADPQLQDNRRGRAVLEYLRAGQAEREATIGRIGVRLLLEGTIFSGAGEVIDGGELAAGTSNWSAILTALTDWIFPAVFPRWPEIAPRARVLTEGNAQTLALETLRRPVDAPYFAPSHERLVRALAEPLGVARADAGRWKISPPKAEIGAFFLTQIADGTTLGHIEAAAAKSEWGIAPELARLVLCALIRSGELAAFDARGSNVAAHEIGFPLARSIRTFAPGRLMSEAAWDAARKSTVLLANAEIGAVSFASQEAARATLSQAREEWRAEAELFAARLHQLRRALGGTWAQCEDAQQKLVGVIAALEGDALEAATHFEENTLREILETWRAWQNRFENQAAPVVEARLFLAHPQLVAPEELRASREELLARFGAGESVLRDETLLENFENWRTEYGRIYTSWHATQNDAARWNSLQRLANSDALRALKKFGSLQNRELPFASEIAAALREESAKRCTRDGEIAREAVCASCRLRLGERVLLNHEIEPQFETARDAIATMLAEENVALGLKRNAGAALLEWRETANEGAATESLGALWPLLDDAAVRSLDEALRPRRRFSRSFSELRAQLQCTNSRGEAEKVFAAWMGGNENLARDDEIVWDD